MSASENNVFSLLFSMRKEKENELLMEYLIIRKKSELKCDIMTFFEVFYVLPFFFRTNHFLKMKEISAYLQIFVNNGSISNIHFNSFFFN